MASTLFEELRGSMVWNNIVSTALLTARTSRASLITSLSDSSSVFDSCHMTSSEDNLSGYSNDHLDETGRGAVKCGQDQSNKPVLSRYLKEE